MKLKDHPNLPWDSAILYRLAVALGFEVRVEGDVRNPTRFIYADPDDVIERAISAINEFRKDETK